MAPKKSVHRLFRFVLASSSAARRTDAAFGSPFNSRA